MKQKTKLTIGGVVYQTAMKFEVNYREKSPVVAQVVLGNKILQYGDVLLCHHNSFYHPSPYHVQDDLYSIPFNRTIFAILRSDGGINPVMGNIIGDRIPIPTPLQIPQPETYKDRIRVINGGWTKYKEGDIVFTRPSAPYDIVFIVGNIEYRVTKVPDNQVCGVEKKRTEIKTKS